MTKTPTKTNEPEEEAKADKDPVPPVVPGKVKPVEIAKDEPYPSGGKPRDAEADFEAAHGYRRTPKEE